MMAVWKAPASLSIGNLPLGFDGVEEVLDLLGGDESQGDRGDAGVVACEHLAHVSIALDHDLDAADATIGHIPAGVVLDVIVGELFDLPDDPAVLAALDMYEGCPPHSTEDGLFVRARGTATIGEGEPCACWVYVYNREVTGLPPIPGGDYRAWLRRGE